MISQEYTVDADGFQEYFYEELDFFINHFNTRFFFRFITNHDFSRITLTQAFSRFLEGRGRFWRSPEPAKMRQMCFC